MAYIVADKIRPCNETRFTLYPVRRVFKSLKEQAADCLGVVASEVSERRGDTPVLPPYLTFVPNSEPPSNGGLSNSHKRTEFGRGAIARIFDAAGAMDREAPGPQDYLFLTATLPGDTEEAKWGIAEYAHEIIDGLKSWLSKRMLNRLEFYVWENQRRGALHFHYCIYCPDKSVSDFVIRNFKEEMVRLYDGIEKKHGCNLWGKYGYFDAAGKAKILQARVEVVYKSVGAYMAGYLGGKGGKHSKDKNHRYYPKRWFGVSRPLSSLISEHTKEIKHEFTSLREAKEFLERIYEDSIDESLTHRKFLHKIGEGVTATLFHTQEKQQELWQLRNMLRHTPENHPNISAFTLEALKSTLQLREALRKSAFLQDTLQSELQELLRDSMFTASLRSGVLKREAIQALEKTFCLFDWSSSSCPITRSCFNKLLTFNLMAAHYFPQMRFNQWGVLNNEKDFTQWVDKRRLHQYAGTSADEATTQTVLDGSSPLFGSELGTSLLPTQQCLFSD